LSSAYRPVGRRRIMTYHAGFELFTLRNHNEEVLREVSKQRLEKRLQEARQPQPGQQFVHTLRRMLPLPR
jgi:hypothetical protein